MVEKVESLSPTPVFITSSELVEGIKNGRITTSTIMKENLPYHLEAAIETHFEVTVIAQPGQYYIAYEVNPAKRRLKTSGQESKTSTITPAKSHFPVREGYVGISFKRPEGVIDDTPFNLALQQIEQRGMRKSL